MSVNKPLFTIATIAALSLLSAGTAMAAGEFVDAPDQAVVSTANRAAVHLISRSQRRPWLLASPFSPATTATSKAWSAPCESCRSGAE